jgi:hypothetical protein
MLRLTQQVMADHTVILSAQLRALCFLNKQMSVMESLINNGANIASTAIDQHAPESLRANLHKIKDIGTSALHNIRRNLNIKRLHDKPAAAIDGMH